VLFDAGRLHPVPHLRSLAATLGFLLLGSLTGARGETIRIDSTPGHETNTFVPDRTLGAGIDRIPRAATDKLFTEPVIRKVLSAGWQTVSYRQNTELHVEAWHWNPQGTWSDPGGRGYFTGSSTPTESIRHSFGYFLPHRGFTRNDGSESGYSRLTDGDLGTWWKSNPYLFPGGIVTDGAGAPSPFPSPRLRCPYASFASG
jgi:hypothetical protein